MASSPCGNVYLRLGFSLKVVRRQAKLSRWTLLGIVATILFMVFAETSKAQGVDLSHLIDDSWSSVKAVYTTFTVKKVEGLNMEDNFKADFDWREDLNNRFRIEFVMSWKGQESFMVDEAYDGLQYVMVDSSGKASMSKVSKSLPAHLKSRELQIFPFEPYRFLTEAKARSSNSPPTLHRIVQGLESEFLHNKEIELKEARFSNQSALSFKVHGGEAGEYEVFLSGDSRQLLGWRYHAKDGGVDTELVVEGWSDVPSSSGSVHYPSLFTIRYFSKSDNNDVAGALTHGYSASLNLRLATSDTSEVEFALDPSISDYIYDIDSDVLIPVPK